MTDTLFPPNRIRPRPGLLGGFPRGVADKERLAEILRLRAEGRKMWEIGLRLHITKARVSQLLKKAEAEGIDTASASEIVSP